VFLRTALWTVIQVTFHVSLGLFLAILLNRPMKLRGLYRTLLIIPWALPQVIASLAWRGEYNFEYGFPNVMLTRLGLAAIQWKSDPFWNFVAMNITNIWLGIPFMIVILLGGLQSLSPSYFEAADMDGASGWRKLRTITLPLIKPIMTPAIVLGIIWTFNNFNVPYFINENNLETSDILVTALFRSAFDFNRYGFSAMFALVIFLILLGITIVYMRMVSFSPSTVASRKARETLTVGENL
jgi:arabinogalactan oligomer/maltooligosaccharide transport system permease protein